jgi:asparagine synthase (glutamine-hydrolysing)
VDGWFRSSVEGKLSELLLDESSFMYDLLKRKPVRKLLSDHRSGRQDNHKLLFSLVMVEQWLRGARSRQERLTSAAPQGMHAVRLAS